MSELEFRWAPDLQWIRKDDEGYYHRGRTKIGPSHDVAHLILAAGSSLPWLPIGTPDEIKVVEFNAVVLQLLIDHSANTKATDVMSRVLERARWYVEEYQHPFPHTFGAALDAWRDGVDVESVLRLAPIFVHTRAWEIATPDYMERTCGGKFLSIDTPEVTEISRRPVAELAKQLEDLLTVQPGFTICPTPPVKLFWEASHERREAGR